MKSMDVKIWKVPHGGVAWPSMIGAMDTKKKLSLLLGCASTVFASLKKSEDGIFLRKSHDMVSIEHVCLDGCLIMSDFICVGRQRSPWYLESKWEPFQG
jgi:hypothetical protein